MAHHIGLKGFDGFCPWETDLQPQRSRQSRVPRPLFPGYVFCRVDPRYRLPILTIPDVIRFVGVGKVPVPISDTEMYAVQRLVDSGLPTCSCAYLRVGQTMHVNQGPLTGLDGILLRVKGADRLVISVELLERSVCVEIGSSQVSADQSLEPAFVPA